MRTDAPRRRAGSGLRSGVLLGVLAVALGAATGASAQAPLFLIDADTRVSSVDLRFAETRTLDAAAIRQRLALRGPSFAERVQGARTS